MSSRTSDRIVIAEDTGYYPQLSEGAVKPPVFLLDSTIRLSIGIEHPSDLIADIAQALNEA